ncbi:hypothetical protein L0991_05770 [Vibrio chagasii]|uniref:hypothetical protein n=1 Tax=Vibrio chagasii TaxID=170679 RepID=UPI0035A70457
MTTIIDVLDTAVKIGLGAAITGFVALKSSKVSHQQEVFKATLEDKKKLVFQLTELLESIETSMNECIVAKNSERDIIKSKQHLSELCSSAYRSRSIANLLGNDELVSLTSCICKDAEQIYPLLFRSDSDIEELSRSITEYKLSTYPVIRKLYSELS